MASQAVTPFKDYLGKKMAPYQIGVPLIFSVLISFFTGFLTFNQYSENNLTFIESIAPHVAALLETQDRPEIQRFLKSVSVKQGSAIEVINRGEIISSSLDGGRIGTKIETSLIKIPFFNLSWMNGKIVSITNVKRIGVSSDSNSQMAIYLNLSQIIFITLIMSLSVFVATFFTIKWLISKLIKTAKDSLSPLSELELAIKSLQDNFSTANISVTSIQELENIRASFIETNLKLNETTEKLAKTKAKELAAGAYRNLIHDLHVPVSALRNHITVLGHERANIEDKENALKRIVELAEQILRQVKSARSNLGLEITLKDEDLIESIRKASGDAQTASLNKPQVEVKESLPPSKFIKPHDPVMLGRAISNLVTNAIEAAHHVVEIELEPVGDDVSIRISDDGNGISQEDASLYLQGRGKSTKSDRLGIGLASANHIVRSHGGKIIYQPSKFGGACFEVRFQGVSV